MTRPQYETPQDRANEVTAVSTFAAKLGLFFAARRSDTGQTFLQNPAGRVVAAVETKCRSNTAFKFTTFKLSARKVLHAERLWDRDQIPTFLLVQFSDRMMLTKLHPLKKPLPRVIWGRKDRNDPDDIELAVEITMGRFREVR